MDVFVGLAGRGVLADEIRSHLEVPCLGVEIVRSVVREHAVKVERQRRMERRRRGRWWSRPYLSKRKEEGRAPNTTRKFVLPCPIIIS